MTRLLRGALLVAVCVLAAGFLTAAAATTVIDASDWSVAQSETDGPSYASPATGSATGEGYESVSMDLSAAVQADAQELRAGHDRRVLDAELAAAANDSARESLAEQRLDAIESRYERLDEREQELLRAYGQGEINTQLFVSELTNLRTALEAQSELQDQTSSEVSTPEQLLNFESTLLASQPVTERIAAAQTGGEDTTVYLLTGQQRFVLATFDGETFLRQATLRDERDLNAGLEADQFRTDGRQDPTAISDRATNLYPWVFQRGEEVVSIRADRKVYPVTVDYTQGELQLYFDGATTDVFQENYYQNLDDVRFTTTATNETDSVNVTVDQTQETGPMEVTVTSGGQPVEGATVRILDLAVGTTDGAGQLWAVEPRIESDLVVTTPDGERVTVTV